MKTFGHNVKRAVGVDRIKKKVLVHQGRVQSEEDINGFKSENNSHCVFLRTIESYEEFSRADYMYKLRMFFSATIEELRIEWFLSRRLCSFWDGFPLYLDAILGANVTRCAPPGYFWSGEMPAHSPAPNNGDCAILCDLFRRHNKIQVNSLEMQTNWH